MSTDVDSYSPTGRCSFHVESGEEPPIVELAGGQAFQFADRHAARAWLSSSLAALDHEDGRDEDEDTCESCGMPADVTIADGSTWCRPCDDSARRLGYDEDDG